MARSAILRHSVRLYGTTEPESIGQAVSSGEIRMPNLDVVDLANRVPVGAHGMVGQGVMGAPERRPHRNTRRQIGTKPSGRSYIHETRNDRVRLICLAASEAQSGNLRFYSLFSGD